MSPPPAVSVIMSIYNREVLAPRAIASILAQDFADFEFIVVNDGSTDRTLDVVRGFDDPRIRVASLPVNSGIPTARNVGLRMARGAFIAQMDSDDFSLPDRLGRQHDFLRANPDVHFIGANALKIVGETRHALTYSPDDAVIKARLVSLDARGMLHPVSMMRADFLEQHDLLYPMERTDHDHALWTEAMIRGARFSNVQEVLLHHYRHKDNATAESGTDYPAHERRKTALHTNVLCQFFPSQPYDDLRAIARWMELGRRNSIPEVCLAIAAIRRALGDTTSYCGESKREVGRILNAQFTAALEALHRAR